ncbi:hypothetical protein K440DRAFT_660764 [Wilcoxina mikolae CBS 423.85]|nr:hypothetical protein K440DRAFT_660764 [Wilcoxina mikolae CBS 423.85]
MKPMSQWSRSEYEQFYIEPSYLKRRGDTLPKGWLTFPDRDNGVEIPMQLTPAEKAIVDNLFGHVTRALCSPSSHIVSMLEGYIVQKSPPLSAPFFVDLGRVLARKSGKIPHKSRSLLRSAQILESTPEAEQHARSDNHPTPETPSPACRRVKRLRTASSVGGMTAASGGLPYEISPTSSKTESEASEDGTGDYKISSSQVEEDEDADLDRVRCETATQTMLLSFLQTVCNARGDRTTTQPTQASPTAATAPHLAFSFEPDHRRIEVEELHGSGGTSTFTSINDGSLVAKVRTGTYTHYEETFSTYDRDPNSILCILECKRLLEGNKATFPQQAGEILAAMRERFDHLFAYAREDVKAETFINTMTWAQRTMFLISAEQSKLRFSQATFTPAYIKPILGYVGGTETLEVSVSPEFDLLLQKHRCEAAELVLKMIGLLEREWEGFFAKKP